MEVLTPMNPLIKIRSVANSSLTICDSHTCLSIFSFQQAARQESTSYFITLALGLSTVAFLKPLPDSPSLENSLAMLSSGAIDLPSELCAVLLGLKSGKKTSELVALDDLELLNLLGNSKMAQIDQDPLVKVRRLLTDWETECPPVYSVLGSILSQLAVDFVKDPACVTPGWLVFDGLSGTANIVEVSAKLSLHN